MTQLFHIVKWQSFKQIYAITDADLPKEIGIDPSLMVHLKVKSNSLKSEIGVLDYQATYDKLWGMIKERISLVLAQRGINPQDYFAQSSPQSGFAKLVDNAKLVERREDDIARYSYYEKQIYNTTVAVYNRDKMASQPAMNDKAKFNIQFGDVGYQMSIQDQVLMETHDLTYNLSTPAQILQQRDPFLSDEDAKQKYESNIAENKKGKPTAIESQPLTVIDD
jgi:hypothetical protein